MPTAGRAPTPPQDPNADVAGLGYEQARDELVAVVARLEAGAGSLEDSLALWERGEALAARCQQWLDGARTRLDAAQAASAEQDAPHRGTAGHEDAEPEDGDGGAQRGTARNETARARSPREESTQMQREADE